tara:strand:+ start:6581 stop:7093 length:513 start_codon:yes stop_codon:yes gene_type:complete
MDTPALLQAVTLPVTVEAVNLRKDRSVSVRVCSTLEFTPDECLPLYRLQGQHCSILLTPSELDTPAEAQEPEKYTAKERPTLDLPALLAAADNVLDARTTDQVQWARDDLREELAKARLVKRKKRSTEPTPSQEVRWRCEEYGRRIGNENYYEEFMQRITTQLDYKLNNE